MGVTHEGFGITVGRRSIQECKDGIVTNRGIISLWYNGNKNVSEFFYSKEDRKNIITKWHKLYNIKDKRNIYFQISYE